MVYEISNEMIKVAVNSMGAEPWSIKSVSDGLEYLWQGDPKYWARRSPTLFPIVCMVKNNRYTYEGNEYELENHGFTKESEFELVDKAEDGLTFKLVDNEQTLKKYPFPFELITSYKLYQNSLLIGHSVKNTGKETMWFSIGEHPGFNCPLMKNESIEDYSLVFEKKETTERLLNFTGLLSGEKEAFLNDENEIKLTHKLFDKKVIILKDLKSKYITMKSKNHDRKVTVYFTGYPYMGIWAPLGESPFFCIEPWYGVSSTEDGPVDITEKEGIMKLGPRQEFSCSYTIAID